MRYLLLFVGLMNSIELVLKHQGDTLTVLCGILEQPVIVNEDIQGDIVLAIDP